MRILLIEDYPPLAEAVIDALRRAAFTVDHASSAARARHAPHGVRSCFVHLPWGFVAPLNGDSDLSNASNVLQGDAQETFTDFSSGR